ncbi:precorrin-3B C(17)-methyltransferase [Planktothrix mougeotii]|uniref:Precorrin-3B C(17)-methyltransferase n=1 Tax=Planktothrix mougeotii LEGE 06226 TaxID=1828728 RepID=A0ABR9UGS0_9CYAN|nr:precorrin-3B C(17)-methyltransferase [Planktothrix mougeotii]MBE9145660.1 precorrin-3B C(17)-methyltransferase [Planktothrix mougeotii LEGE 06226]
MSFSQFQSFQPIAAIATTPQALQQLQPLCQGLNAILWIPNTLHPLPGTQVYSGSLSEHLASLWSSHRGFIFGLAAGAVVRLITPLLQHKSSDPAVVVLDQTGKFVISLCSGHQGGADQLTRLVARQLNATPIITGATNALGLPALDLLGVPFGWRQGPGDWTAVSGAIARGEQVNVLQDGGSTLWQTTLPPDHPFDFTPNSDAKFHICISSQRRVSNTTQVQWFPRVLWVGVGCERNTPRALIEKAIEQALQQYHLAEEAIAGIATLDIKGDEAGLVELCEARNWPLRTFPSEVLRQMDVPNPSEIVEAEVGTPSVAEAAALQAAGVKTLFVSKQIYRDHLQTSSTSNRIGQAVTVAIAQAEQEYTGRTGHLFLVGTGPGELDQITPAAQTAIVQADAVIGYSLYLDLIRPLLRPGQIVESYPITQERQRGERAIDLAQWGLTVAVVSSGDCGIYGMAGLVFEQLRARGWDGKTPMVQVFPGISALQAAASRVGAPLMHDFCAISLSDLLTPWEVIQNRLIAAAQADFVCILYNPRSRTRTEQLHTAKRIFLDARSGNIPVAMVRSAYRCDQEITLTTLEQFNPDAVDMLTTVIIGNQSTDIYENWMITPRGYLGQ